jgi:hypothetical protein
MIKVESKKEIRVCQGDIIKDVEFIEYAVEKEGHIEISKIVFPLVIVLTQDCDLEQDFNNRADVTCTNQDKYLISAIVAPIYNLEHIYRGEHLSGLGLKMQTINSNDKKTENKNLKSNHNPRYHFLNFLKVPIVDSVIDFKHYFTVNIRYLDKVKETNFICKVSPLYRESISQRFAYFLSRIGLPDIVTKQ